MTDVPDVLIASLSPTGHVGPLLNVAHDLVTRGHRVTVMTGAEHIDRVAALGATPHPLPAAADFDPTRDQTDRRRRRSRIESLNSGITRLFLAPMPLQVAELRAALSARRFDVIIADYGFFGVLPLLLQDREARPPIVSYTPCPTTLSSRDAAPHGFGLPPAPGRLGRLRNRLLNALSHKMLLRRTQRAANTMLEQLGAPRLPIFLLDLGILADRYVMPTVPDFEYPRADLPPGARFVGAVHPLPSRGWTPPRWWHRLDGDRPVVHVTQGTVDNEDLSRLIEPTIVALADRDVTVVVTTGGRDVTDIGVPIPSNTLVAEYIPHEVLLPRIDVIVTNGGYGAVQRALAAGVPLVVAGSTEDKPEVAARVAWSGAGVNLRTGTPTPAQLRSAVTEVLADPCYLARARDLEAAFARRDGVAEIAALVDEVIAERAAVAGRS